MCMDCLVYKVIAKLLNRLLKRKRIYIYDRKLSTAFRLVYGPRRVFPVEHLLRVHKKMNCSTDAKPRTSILTAGHIILL